MGRLGLGLGLNIYKLWQGGGVSPPLMPSLDAWHTSYDADNFLYGVGDKAQTWKDLETDTLYNLTQNTDANQMVLVEEGVLGQDTVSSQPTLIDVGGDLAVTMLGTTTSLGGFNTGTGDFTLAFDMRRLDGLAILFNGNDMRALLFAQSISLRKLNNVGIGDLSFTTADLDTRGILFIRRTSLVWEAYKDGEWSTSYDETGSGLDLYINSLGTPGIFNANQNIFGFDIFDRALTQTEIDDYETSKPSDATEYNPSSITSGLNNNVSRWQSLQYNGFNNVLRSDATNDFMNGLPTQAGDFSLPFRKQSNTLATLKTLFSSSTTSAEIRINASNQYEVVSDAGTVFTYTTIETVNEQETRVLILDGTDLKLYKGSTTFETKDFTGEAFTLDRLSKSLNSSDSDWKELGIKGSVFTQTEIDWFYYLRDENNNILMPPIALA